MILTDMGFWYAFFNSRDKLHKQAVHVMQNLDEGLITTWPVITGLLTTAVYFRVARVNIKSASISSSLAR